MRLAVLALFAIAVCSACGSSPEQPAAGPPEPTTTAAEPPPARERAPDLVGDSLAGGDVSLAAHRGRPVLINVWSSW